MKTHCCEDIGFFIAEGKVGIRYCEIFREYSLALNNGTDGVQVINFCPWCGNKFPKDLSDIYYVLLREDCGIEPDFELTNVPEEFKSDAWWKKRGL